MNSCRLKFKSVASAVDYEANVFMYSSTGATKDFGFYMKHKGKFICDGLNTYSCTIFVSGKFSVYLYNVCYAELLTILL